MKRWQPLGVFATFCLAIAVLAGCASLDEKQRAWIFSPSDRTWSSGVQAAAGMEEVWIDFDSRESGKPARLNGLWLAGNDTPAARALHEPVMLYLHGARYNIMASTERMRRMRDLGFSVLAIDYRGFGKSTAGLPSETYAYEDARQAWEWLAKKYPDRPRYIFGHSLGGTIAINLATEVNDEHGVIVEGTFTSIADVVSTTQWGWMPVSLLITQRFEAVRKVSHIGSPLLVVHGSDDSLILPALGRKLFAAAQEPKAFVLVEGGSHHNTNALGLEQYRSALTSLYGDPAARAEMMAVRRQPVLPALAVGSADAPGAAQHR